MRFTVTWSAEAQDQLTRLWLQQPPGERGVISQRADWLDRTLRENAHQKGAVISTDPMVRGLTPPEFFEPPTLGIAFAVSVDGRSDRGSRLQRAAEKVMTRSVETQLTVEPVRPAIGLEKET